jgi:hypothetical protein
MPAIAIVGIALTVASMAQSAEAARDAKQLAKKTGNQNQAVDEAAAKQLELNQTQNIRNERADNAVYISKQQATYASFGVLSSGSPLDVEATTAGKMEQAIQQRWIDTNVEANNIRQQGQYGNLAAQAQASAIQTQSNINMLKGGAQLASQAYGAYQSGAFSSSKAAGPATSDIDW